MAFAPTAPDLSRRLRQLIRDVPDYPKPGILFKDITPLLGSAEAFTAATVEMARPFENAGVTHVVAIESRGFILGGPIAQQLGAGFVPVRKPGKLPSETRREEYALEYGTDTLEIHADACGDGARVLIVDDVLATGGTADATRRLVEVLGASIVGFSFLIALSFLPGRDRLAGTAMHAVVTF
ncbi:MAG TPA: adenine phosphoribosyltransferase [Gemmatimonadaceae bacterium]|nr:adenine phosphoribosyltransferase [Gemmatimonadaceae bacterium]